MNGFDSSLLLEVFRFETRLERLDGGEVWFQPNGISWQWTRPSWSFPTAGRTPRAGLVPLSFPEGSLWGVRMLALPRPGEEERDFSRLLEDVRNREAPGLELTPRGPEDLARLAPLNLKLLALVGRGPLSPEVFGRLAELQSLTHLILQAPLQAEALEAIASLEGLRVLALQGGALGDEEVVRPKRLTRQGDPRLGQLSLDRMGLRWRGGHSCAWERLVSIRVDAGMVQIERVDSRRPASLRALDVWFPMVAQAIAGIVAEEGMPD